MRARPYLRRLLSSVPLTLGLAMPAFAAQGTYALTAEKLYVAPDAAPLERAVILVRDGKIAAVGSRERYGRETLISLVTPTETGAHRAGRNGIPAYAG